MKFYILLFGLVLAIDALSFHSAWIQYKIKHSKKYQPVEDKFRYQIFQNSLRRIKEHNAKYEKGEESYFLTTTKFADWSNQEFRTMLNYRVDNKHKNKKFAKQFKSTPNVNIPDSIDWRDKNAVVEVKNQSECSSGWAFSVTGAVEGQLALLKNKKVSMSEQELVDCSTWNFGCFGGNTHYAYIYIEDHGLSSEEQYPYEGKDENTCRSGDITDKVLDSIEGFATVEQSENSLLQAVATIGPISVAICADEDFGWKLYGGGIYDDPRCKDDLNQGALVVGYGTAEKDYWIIKNSWGDDWGEKGYVRLVRGKEQCGISLDSSYPLLRKH